MKLIVNIHIRSLATILSLAAPVWAQSGTISVPNPMAAHNVFIILITAASLAWAASFSVQFMKERKLRQLDRPAILKVRESLLDEITKLEISIESGTITKDKYEKRLNEMRRQLSRVAEKLHTVNKTAGTRQ